jgi:amino acid adenylation domain-containing protein
MNLSVLELFERQVSAAADAIAVTTKDCRLTYSQLNLQAECIADGLRAAGVSPGCLVGLLLDRSPAMIAALLGTWKAGAAWIPCDPTAPDDRIRFMLTDAAPAVVLTQRKFAGRVSEAPELYLEELCSGRTPSGVGRAPHASHDLAYAIYTSGSTGQPKAARVSHGGLSHIIQCVVEDLALTPRDVVLAWTTIAFDAAGLEIYSPLITGASLYLLQNNTAREGGLTPEQVHRSAATVIFGTPTMYRLLLERGWRGDKRIQLTVGGEALSLPLAKALAAHCRSLWNQYGPTETSIAATRAKISVDVEKITIGRPFAGVTIHLLDQSLQPVPTGSTGELYIGGAGVGLGYLNRPELTQAQFLTDPFSEGTQGSLYKTGDLAVQHADGNFEFVGRVDDQVKLRGYRIELGEIESALMRAEGVQAAVARVIELEPGDRRLIAFVVGDAHSVPRWRRYLQQQLPEYMVPSEFLTLECFPTTANGKVDLRALDALRRDRTLLSSVSGNHSALENAAMEERLRSTWERILRVTPVGLDDDFFALGGHSLLAARMLSQVQQWFGSRLPHSVLVEHPTIHRFAAYLREAPKGQWPSVITIQSGTSQQALFVAHGIGGSVLSFVEFAAELGSEQPVYGLQLPAFIEPDQDGLRALAANYVEQMRALQPVGPYHLAGHSSGGVIAFEIACQLTEMGEQVGLLALLDCDPNVGKLIRRPFQDWNSFKAAVRRAYSELTTTEFTLLERLDRAVEYRKLKVRTWFAARARRSGKVLAGTNADGYLALALREYELRCFPGDATLFLAGDEPGLEADPTVVWAGKILGEREAVLIPGTHFTMLARPQVIPLAQEIGRRIAQGVCPEPADAIA